MIAKKLYIPTSTLNFNNIMSSESISPAAFYANRRFGYKRFEKVAPNNLDNLILLYDKYPIFNINDKELENYPLVIEVGTQDMPDDCVQEKEGVFFTSKTIYLNPFSTRIIFRNETERTASLSKAEPIIETKLIPLYQGQLVVLSDEIKTFNWCPINVDDSSDYDNIAVSYDITVNKLKGMLYGYLLGANESSSKEIVAMKKRVKELRNVLSAILASPDGRATRFQQQQLDNLYAGINQAFYSLSGAQSRINEVISQKIECYKVPTFVEILKGEGLYQEWFKKQLSQLSLRYYQITPFYLSYQPTDKVSELDRYIDNIERMIQTYDVKTKLDISKLPIIQNRRVVEVPEQKEFLPILFNGYMDEVWNGTEFLSSRYEFAKVGGKLFREISGDNWENSPARTYINSLLKNLNEYTEFDINSTDSDILKSFAAFCQKGESDIDKLRDYLISNGIGDFRIAFALWGLVFGFAEMPKTLTNEFFEDQDEQYIAGCYKSIYKQLHAIELQGTLERTLNREDKTNNVLQGKKKIDNMGADFFSGKSKGQTRDLERSREQVESNPIVLKIEGHPKYGKKKYGKFVDQIMEQNITNWDKIRKLSKGKDWMAIIDDLSIESPKTEPVLFDEIEMHPIGPNFYIDKNVWYHIEPLIADSKTKKTIKGEIEWIQKAHQDGGYRKGKSWVECKETDNKSVIHHFYYNAKKNGVEENTLNKVVEELKRLYHVQS